MLIMKALSWIKSANQFYGYCGMKIVEIQIEKIFMRGKKGFKKLILAWTNKSVCLENKFLRIRE